MKASIILVCGAWMLLTAVSVVGSEKAPVLMSDIAASIEEADAIVGRIQRDQAELLEGRGRNGEGN